MLGTVVWTTVAVSLATRCLAAKSESTGCAQEKTWPLSLKSYPQECIHNYGCRSCGKPLPPRRPGLWKNRHAEGVRVRPFPQTERPYGLTCSRTSHLATASVRAPM